MKLFSSTINSLEQGLSYSSLKQKVISENVANADTPNYKAKTVTFKSELAAAVENGFQARRTDYRHFDFKGASNSPYSVTARPEQSYNHNGNSVDIDKEMSEMAENQIYYNAVADRLNGKFNSLKTVIRGGK